MHSGKRCCAQAVLDEIGIPSSQYPEGHPDRAIFCSRTLNLRAIQAIGAAASFKVPVFAYIVGHTIYVAHCFALLAG